MKLVANVKPTKVFGRDAQGVYIAGGLDRAFTDPEELDWYLGYLKKLGYKIVK